MDYPHNQHKQRSTSPITSIRFVTSTALFDGHDASINVIRRILQQQGVEVIHLGHNRSAHEIVMAAIEEDAHAIAISSYQGGHIEFFTYCLDLLKEHHASHISLFGGGGGTMTRNEIAKLEALGVTKIYAAEDGLKFGLEGMINDMIQRVRISSIKPPDFKKIKNFADHPGALSELLSVIELNNTFPSDTPESYAFFEQIKKDAATSGARIIGMTGPGGAGKSSVLDEIILRLIHRDPNARIAVIAIDPTRAKTGGALLGDRLRMNSLKHPHCYMRSFATRSENISITHSIEKILQVLKAAKFDWIFVETSGIGQSDISITKICPFNVYVMTSEFGAPTQLEKINMFDFANLVILNKFDKPTALDALEDIRKQYRRNHPEFLASPLNMLPIFGSIASRFLDQGIDRIFEFIWGTLKNTPPPPILSSC